MKRILSLFMAVLMSVGIINFGAFASANAKSVKQVSSIVDVLVGEELTAQFVYEADEKVKGDITLKDESGMVISKMKSANKDNNSYYAEVELLSNERGTETFYAYCGDTMVDEYTVNYYVNFTDAEIATAHKLGDELTELEDRLENSGATDTAIYEAAFEFLSESDDVESVNFTDGLIEYRTEAGVPGLFVIFDNSGMTKGTTSTQVIKTDDVMDFEMPEFKSGETYGYQNPNILVIRPFRNSDFNNDYYLLAANKIKDVTGGRLTVIDNQETVPINLLNNFYKNGFIMVDTHGTNYANKSYMLVEDGRGYTSADLNALRAIPVQDNKVVLNGEFFQVHYEEQNRNMNNAFMYFGICEGAMFDTIYRPFIDLGVTAVMAFDKTVTVQYDVDMLNTIADCLKSTNPVYTAREALDYAKSAHGSYDPYGTYRAVLNVFGNENFALRADDNPATGIEFDLDTYTIAVNHEDIIVPTISAASGLAFGYDIDWDISDTSVLRMESDYVFSGLKEGIVTLTCTISDGNYTFSDECTVNVDFVEAESADIAIPGLNMKAFECGKEGIMTVVVYPENASDKSYTISTNNPGCMSIDKYRNKLTANAPGTGKVFVTLSSGVEYSYDFRVKEETVYNVVEVLDEASIYAVVAKNSDILMSNVISNSHADYYEGVSNNGFMTFNVREKYQWNVEFGSNGQIYLYSVESGKYFSQDSNGKPVMTNNRQTAFVVDDRGRLQVVGASDENTEYLRYISKKGFAFGKRSQGTLMAFYKKIEAENTPKITFKDIDGNTIAVQNTLGKGRATAAIAPVIENKTFLGWDIPLAGITQSAEANPIYRDGTVSDNKVVVTFYGYDKTVELGSVEVSSGSNVTAPQVPERAGYEFIGWSESLTRVDHNMTVFAMYRVKPEYEIGDVNRDGKINTGDAVATLRHIAGLDTIADENFYLADVTGDGKINTGDAVAILRKIAGLN